MWRLDGQKILRRMEKVCGTSFPRRGVEEGLEVYLYRRRREDADRLADMDETDPKRINLYLSRDSTWRSVKSTIVHELIHCLMWQAYYYDRRRSEVKLFEDYFADELLTSLIEQVVLGRRLDRIDYDEALNYAMSQTKQRILGLRKRKEHYRKMMDSLKEFLKDYRRKVRSEGSDFLRERRRLLLELPSPLPASLEDI